MTISDDVSDQSARKRHTESKKFLHIRNNKAIQIQSKHQEIFTKQAEDIQRTIRRQQEEEFVNQVSVFPEEMHIKDQIVHVNKLINQMRNYSGAVKVLMDGTTEEDLEGVKSLMKV